MGCLREGILRTTQDELIHGQGRELVELTLGFRAISGASGDLFAKVRRQAREAFFHQAPDQTVLSTQSD